MWRKIFKPLPAGEYELRERMLRSVIQISGVAVFLGMLEMFLIMEESKVMLPVMGTLLVIIAATLVGAFKYRKYELAAKILGFIIIIVLFPIMFIVNDGVNSGSTIWLALGLWYIFIMFRGRTLVTFLIMAVLAYGAAYLTGYFHPEILVPMSSRKSVYIDSFFSLMAVSFIGGITFQIHVRIFEKEHELNLKQKEELKQAGESKDIFFANMSHEIRTPINAIMGLNELILRYSEQEEVQECAQDIQIASNMLLNQVNDILDLSQMEVNKMHIVPVNYQIQEVIGELVDLVRVQADKKGLDLYVDVDKNLPAVLNGDEKRLKQVLLNIMDNAVKYT